MSNENRFTIKKEKIFVDTPSNHDNMIPLTEIETDSWYRFKGTITIPKDLFFDLVIDKRDLGVRDLDLMEALYTENNLILEIEK